jgi:hypothetical protein
MSLKIEIRTIKHKQQRYPTVGDWILDDRGVLVICVSDLGNPDYEFMVGIHEALEAYICLKRGITADMVDDWDMGEGKDLEDPGSHPKAPYHKEHMLALKIEQMIARELGVNWKKYENKLAKVCPT